MMKKTLLTALLLTSGTAFAAGGAQSDAQAKQGHKSADQMFQKLDKDNDRNISRTEAQGHQQLLQSFAEVDKDNDGVLSADEIGNWTDKQAATGGQQQQRGTAQQQQGMGQQDQGVAQQNQEMNQQQKQQGAQQIVQRLDQDSDGKISKHEADQNKKLVDAFDDIDSDENGTLSAEELSNWDGIQDAQQY